MSFLSCHSCDRSTDQAWETEEAETEAVETGEDSGEDLEAVVTVEGAEEVTAISLSIHRFTRRSKTRRTSFFLQQERSDRVRHNL